MIRNRFTILLLTYFICCGLAASAADPGRTAPPPFPEQYRTLSGKHPLTLQWISWERPGTITFTPVKNKRNEYRVKGRQSLKGDYVSIDGTIVQKSAKELFFNGTIKSKVSHVNNGKVCERKGPQTFLSTRNRKYWRLQQMENCEGNRVTDYIDIYF